MSSGSSPKELYQSCATRERNLDRAGLDRIFEWLTRELIFQPLFATYSESASAVPNADSRGRVIDEAIWRGNKYRELRELLAKSKGIEARWILLARWLRQEGICEPEQFLPKEMDLKTLTRKLWRGTRRQDCFYVTLVEIWRPYFLRLLDDRDRLKANGVRRIGQELENLGYDAAAIGVAVHEKRPLEAIYSWLSLRKVGTADSVRNACARASGTIKRLTSEMLGSVYAKEIEELERLGSPLGFLKTRGPSGKRNKG